MRILFCCEFYAPSVGGVQEVVKQLAERLFLRGHDVTVATTKLPTRSFVEQNGVKIKEFEICGNLVRGMNGNLEDYRQFITSETFDVILIKAAQQWTFDALWPVLSKIKGGKVFIPCGFSGLHEPKYAKYFRQLSSILRQFDHLIFYASDYRDINFVKAHSISNFSIIPNGASEVEFSVSPDPSFRQRHGIGTDELLFLTVGSLTGMKGHVEVAQAFEVAGMDGHPATLILNGRECISLETRTRLQKLNDHVDRMLSRYHSYGIMCLLKHELKLLLRKLGMRADEKLGKSLKDSLTEIINRIQNQTSNKRVFLTDLPRAELVQAFMNADLFVFASNIEYSPLVLFESAAAGVPFLSVPVGNAEEIACWTGAGLICPAPEDNKGYTRVDPKVLAKYWSRLVKDRFYLRRLGTAGRKNWAERFTWETITKEYETIFSRLHKEKESIQKESVNDEDS